MPKLTHHIVYYCNNNNCNKFWRSHTKNFVSGSGKLTLTTVDSRGSRFSKIKNRQMAAVALGISNTALLGALYLIFWAGFFRNSIWDPKRYDISPFKIRIVFAWNKSWWVSFYTDSKNVNLLCIQSRSSPTKCEEFYESKFREERFEISKM